MVTSKRAPADPSANETARRASRSSQTGGDPRDPVTQIETYRRMLDVAETAPFEYRPDAERFEWADWAAAARLLNLAPAQPLDAMTAFRRTLTADSAALREREAFDPGEGEAVYCIQYEMLDAAGAAFWVEERGRWAPNPSGARALTAALRVIDDQRRREAHLQSLADVDDLTGHFSRAKLRRELDAWTADPSSREGAPAYLVAGIDDLGAINTDFGFDVADEVICNIASRIESILGAADCLGRSAGNKFGLLLSQSSTGELAERAREIISVVRSSLIDTSAGGIAASISLGAVILDDDVASSEAAMARAEAALDEARRAGRASWAVFSERTDRIGSRRRNSHLTDEILSALNERRVRIAFQPIVADVGETPRRFECLVRLVREDGAVAPAGEIIGAAERLGLVHLLDRRVLELATQVLQTTPDIRLNLNVSWETVKDPVWMDGYLAHLRAHQTVAPRLTVELTETSAVDAVEISCEFVSMIKEIGCSFAIDDFGAGYTSFRNLKAMDIDVLKIDGSFVTGVSESRDNQLFVRTLLDLARNFGVATVAEWVDNPSDAMLLKGLGVDYLQGFFIGKPELEPSWLETAPETAISRRSNPAASAAR